MKIRDVEFVGAIATPGAQPPADLPQIAFSGRSNVGKSSLINRLLGRTRRRVARISTRPGKTTEINFYRVGVANEGVQEFLLADLPGYGYARVPEAIRQGWGPLVERYLRDTPKLAGVVQLLDSRHDPTDDDRRMVEFLAATGRPTLFVLTKIDKLKRSQRTSRFAAARQTLALEAEQVLPFSAVTGEGRGELLAAVQSLLVTGSRAA